MQSFVDEFELPEGDTPRTPATPGSVLRNSGSKDFIKEKYCETDKHIWLTLFYRMLLTSSLR